MAGGLSSAAVGVAAFLGGVALALRFDNYLGPTLTSVRAVCGQVGWGLSGWVAGMLVGLLVGLVVRRPGRLGLLGGVIGAGWFIADSPLIVDHPVDISLEWTLFLALIVGAAVWGGVGVRRTLKKRPQSGQSSATNAVAVALTFLLIGPAMAGPPGQGQVERLIHQLGSAQFAERKGAAKELERVGEAALEPLRKAASGDKDAEVRRRARTLSAKLEKRLLPVLVGRIKSSKLSPEEKGRQLRPLIRRGMKRPEVQKLLGLADLFSASAGVRHLNEEYPEFGLAVYSIDDIVRDVGESITG